MFRVLQITLSDGGVFVLDGGGGRGGGTFFFIFFFIERERE